MNAHRPIRFSRRQGIRSFALLAAGAALPRWYVEECEAAASKPTSLSANDQPAVALVGCGGMGRYDAKNASQFGRLVALCDVDDSQMAEAKKQWPEAALYKDFRSILDRKDIDVMVCGTVDHWHTLVSLAAMDSGKDVYCEKPLTFTIDEGKHLVKAAKRTGRILQTGSQQRSDKYFQLAVRLVHSGRIGRLQHIDVWLPSGRKEGPFHSSPVPAGFDWERWQGPTPKLDYVKERTHVTFRYWWDYSGGTMTDWGAHHHDIAQWALQMDRSGPSTISGRSLVEMIPGGFSAASEYEVQYGYSNGVTQTTRSTADDTWSGGIARKEGQRNGLKFHGTDGWIWVTRGALEVSKPDILEAPLPKSEWQMASQNHMQNFFDCIRTRQQPICDVEIGHRSASVCHLGVLAIRLGRKLNWNPKTEKFVDDRAANQWLSREMRKPYTYGWS